MNQNQWEEFLTHHVELVGRGKEFDEARLELVVVEGHLW